MVRGARCGVRGPRAEVRRARTIVVTVLALGVANAGTAGPSKSASPSTVLALQAWVAAVKGHTPGQADAAVQTVTGFTYAMREDLDAGMGLFMYALVSRKSTIDRENPAVELVGEAGKHASDDPLAFLKRAEVLHGDAAMFGDRYVAEVETPADAETPVRRLKVDPASGMPIDVHDESRVHPLLNRRAVTLDKDGEILGHAVSSWNWPFARWLLDIVQRKTPGDPFIPEWYHATTAYMFANGLYAEATTHVQRAGEVLPEDPNLLFDRACYAEILGLPMHQVLVPDESDAQRGVNQAQWLARRRVTSRGVLGIPRGSVTNAEAERLFRHTLRVESSFVEARVRLARLLELRKRHEEAAAELKTALAANPTGVVGFYAHLFAGRTEQALGRLDAAAHHFAEASALFPDAQSALLASSQIALLGSDVSASLGPVSRLGPESALSTADPWWHYHLAAGRDAEALMHDVWSKVR